MADEHLLIRHKLLRPALVDLRRFLHAPLALWHDHGVSRHLRRHLPQSLLYGLLLVLPASAADAAQPSSQLTRSTASATAAVSQLDSLEQAQAQAVASGDSAAIATTSRALAASLLSHLAAHARQHADAPSAAQYDSELQQLNEAAEATPGGSSPHAHAAAQTTAAEAEKWKQLLARIDNDLGTAEARQGQYAAAKLHFEDALHHAPPTETLLRNLGTVDFRLGDFPAAVKAFGQYLPQPPSTVTSPDLRSQLLYALSLFSTGNFPAAARAFAPVSAETLRDPRSAYSWAFSLAHSGDPKQANALATQLSTQPLPPDVLSLVCHIFIDTETYEQSAACYRKILEADPTVRLAHYQIAESLIRLDRPADAIPELREELTLSPDDPNVQYSLAFALLQTSSKDEAFKLLRSITAAHPEMAQPQYQFGKLLLESGDTATALLHFELAEQADPSLDYVHYQLQATYRKLGRVADADREAKLYRDIKARRRDLPTSR